MQEVIDNLEIKEQKPEKKNLFLIIFSVVYTLSSFIACYISFQQIRTIIISGVSLGVLVLIEIIVSLIVKKRMFFLHGLIGASTILIVLFTIIIFDLSPEKAEKTIPLLMLFLCVIHLVFNIFIIIYDLKKQKHII